MMFPTSEMNTFRASVWSSHCLPVPSLLTKLMRDTLLAI
jgi:hypothetical protein